MKKNTNFKLLILDIETAPIEAYVWDLWDQNISLEQIIADWSVIAWSAKWYGDKKIMYKDQRGKKNPRNDKSLLKDIWKLMNDADAILTQNGVKFDIKKLNARFVENGYKPPASSKQIDTARIARTKFGFTSNKLEYLTNKLNTKYKKLKSGGMKLWKGCLKDDLASWKQMEQYNKHDVLALEELYSKLAPWDTSFNPNLYTDSLNTVCSCGNDKFHRNGFAFTATGKFQRFICTNCGKESRGRTNLLSKDKVKSLKLGVK